MIARKIRRSTLDSGSYLLYTGRVSGNHISVVMMLWLNIPSQLMFTSISSRKHLKQLPKRVKFTQKTLQEKIWSPGSEPQGMVVYFCQSMKQEVAMVPIAFFLEVQQPSTNKSSLFSPEFGGLLSLCWKNKSVFCRPKNHGISKLMVWRSQNPPIQGQTPPVWRVQWFLGPGKFSAKVGRTNGNSKSCSRRRIPRFRWKNPWKIAVLFCRNPFHS